MIAQTTCDTSKNWDEHAFLKKYKESEFEMSRKESCQNISRFKW